MKNNTFQFKNIIVGLFSFLLIWEVFHLLLNTHTVPSPLETIFYTLSHIGVLSQHSSASSLRVITAIIISMLIGCPLGILIGMSHRANKLISPFLYFIYPIPKVAFLPVFMLMYGLGNTSKIILMVWIIVFQIILSMRDGIKQIDLIYFKVMDSYLVNRRQKIRYLILPAILPNLFTGLRMSIGIALASLFFAENYATTYGIGYYILSAWTKMNYVEMFSGILTLGFVGILLFKVLDYIETSLTPWQAQRG
ncbi:ABC transporter permease [Petrocella atlantisensis]|uniref:ABC transporter permease n=1 Tax=Petrocella atlantisensis TaxID=2173034 RepID=A0A3P7S1Z5_9FIRM|nr:ABC transporter permease [Petrocella atlantisensis]VDN46809.1 ABC transporter permease [Petrocella atlantisensis]